jgi:AcrR family transcriptional regulator
MTRTRTYSSPHRVLGAAQTRSSIIEQAGVLFAERGYGRVTIADIAAAAGVAAKTVFASVGSKADLLDVVVAQGVRDSDYVAVLERLEQTSSRAAALKILAHGTRVGNETQATAIEAIRKAVPVLEDGDALWNRAVIPYREGLTQAATHLDRIGALSEGLSITRAADLLWLYFGWGAWRALVVESGWAWDDAEDFLYHAALAALRRE